MSPSLSHTGSCTVFSFIVFFRNFCLYPSLLSCLSSRSVFVYVYSSMYIVFCLCLTGSPSILSKFAMLTYFRNIFLLYWTQQCSTLPSLHLFQEYFCLEPFAARILLANLVQRLQITSLTTDRSSIMKSMMRLSTCFFDAFS